VSFITRTEQAFNELCAHIRSQYDVVDVKWERITEYTLNDPMET
jgi:hypothetical protein